MKELKAFLSGKKPAILEKWFEDLLKSYPPDSVGFLRNKSKQFSNPVGFTFSRSLEVIIDGLIDGQDLDSVTPALQELVRIRAVQDLAPSQALAFVYHLKGIIRQELAEGESVHAEELLALESNIDALSLLAFDEYMRCREKICDLRAQEFKNMTFRLLQRANLVCEIPGQ